MISFKVNFFAPKGYPLISLNWMIIPSSLSPSQTDALRQALLWIYSKRGQEDVELLGYLRLPSSVIATAKRRLP